MRHRRWIWVLTLVLVALACSLLAVWRAFDLGDRLRAGIEQRFREAGYASRIASLSPRLMGIELGGLELQAPDSSWSLSCRSARLQISPLQYLFQPSEPLSLLKEARFDAPGLTLRPALLRMPAERDDSSKGSWEDLFRLAEAVPNCRIQDGSLDLVTGHGRLRILEHLEGLLWPHARGVEARIESGLAQLGTADSLAGRGLSFRALLQPEQRRGSFDLTLNQLRIGSNFLPALQEHLRGEVRGNAVAGGRFGPQGLDSLYGEGRLALEGARIQGFDSLLQGQAEFRLDSRELRVDRLELGLGGWRLQGGGRLAPDLELALDGESLELQDLAHALGELPPDFPLGRLALGLALRGHWSRPEAELALDASRLRVRGEVCDTLSLVLRGRPDSLWIPRIRMEGPRGLRLDGEGRLQAADPQLLELDLRAELPLDGVLPAGLDLREGQALAGEGSLRVTKEEWTTEWQGSLGSSPVALAWSLQASPDGLSGRFRDGERPAGSLTLGGDGTRQARLELLDIVPPLRRLLREPFPWMEEAGSSFLLQRREDAWSAALDLDLPTFRGRVEGDLSGVEEGEPALHADVRGMTAWGDPLGGETGLRFASGLVYIDSLVLLENLQLSGVIDLEQRSYLLDLDSGPVPLRPLLNLLPRESPAEESGRVLLQLAGEGSLDRVGLRGAVDYQWTVPGASMLHWWTQLELGANRVSMPDGRLRYGGLDLGQTRFTFNPDMSSGEGRLQLNQVELASLWPEAPLEAEGLLSGEAQLALQGGSLSMPRAEFHMEPLRLLRRDFDSMHLSCTLDQLALVKNDSLSTTLADANAGVLRVDSLSLVRGGAQPMELLLAGTLPLIGEREIDLRLQARGDPLGLFSKGDEFLRAGGGDFRADLQLAGTLAEPRLLSGEVSLDEGWMNLESVFREVRDLRLDLALADGRLQIRDFHARSGDGGLVIRNVYDVVTEDGRALQPWVFAGIDLGVLQVEMEDPDEYLDVIVPGMMELNWDGEARIQGRLPGEQVWLAGPLERPVVRGSVDVRNIRFTFPFIKGTSPPPPILVATIDFLNSIDWDLAVRPGRNCNYYKEIQGFEDVAFFSTLKGYLDRITVDVTLNRDDDPVLFTGQVDDASFRVEGNLLSTQGDIQYLFLSFSVDEIGMEFDRSSLLPIVWGTADYYAYDAGEGLTGSYNFNKGTRTYYLKLVVEDEFGNLLERGRWSQIQLKLEDEQGRVVEQFLPELGIDPENPVDSFQSVLPGVVAGLLPLPLTPVENRIRRQLDLDVVRIYLPVLQNTAEDLLSTEKDYRSSYWNYLQGTRVFMGKEIGPRYFASWTGQLQSTAGVDEREGFNLFQLYSLEYSVNPNLSLTGEVLFDPLNENSAFKGDPRLVLRYRVNY